MSVCSQEIKNFFFEMLHLSDREGLKTEGGVALRLGVFIEKNRETKWAIFSLSILVACSMKLVYTCEERWQMLNGQHHACP